MTFDEAVETILAGWSLDERAQAIRARFVAARRPLREHEARISQTMNRTSGSVMRGFTLPDDAAWNQARAELRGVRARLTSMDADEKAEMEEAGLAYEALDAARVASIAASKEHPGAGARANEIINESWS